MLYLSHFLSNETPCYAGNKEDVKIEKASCICSGDSSNSMRISIKNHVGTHVDLPRHFDEGGRTLNDFEPQEFFFKELVVIDVPILSARLIEIDDIKSHLESAALCDFLIIRTGYEKLRDTNRYWNDNPGVSPEVGKFLRKNYPSIKAIGFDFISLSSFKYRPLGRVAHKEFLVEENEGNPILIVEDMKLSGLNEQYKKAMVIPMLVDGADGAPVTVIATS